MKNAESHTHYGTRSWWNGTVRTICGQRLPAESGYVGGRATCPACRSLRARGVKWGR